jgi:hypothetical protein
MQKLCNLNAAKTSPMSKLAKIKTTATNASVNSFIDSLQSPQQQDDSRVMIQMMEKATNEKAQMWGPSIIGFGAKRYKSPKTGREVDWFIIGFSPRKTALTLYFGIDIHQHEEYLKKLGKYKTGVGCLYINKLADVDMQVLQKMIQSAV